MVVSSRGNGLDSERQTAARNRMNLICYTYSPVKQIQMIILSIVQKQLDIAQYTPTSSVCLHITSDTKPIHPLYTPKRLAISRETPHAKTRVKSPLDLPRVDSTAAYSPSYQRPSPAGSSAPGQRAPYPASSRFQAGLHKPAARVPGPRAGDRGPYRGS